MKPQLNGQLFSELLPQVASQAQGGHWQYNRSRLSKTVVRVRFYPGSSTGGDTTINITNPELDDGSILNISDGSGTSVRNITNPEVDDDSALNF